jgi:hypothetical protein
MTGRFPVSTNDAPADTTRLRKAKTTAALPPGWVTTTGVGRACPQRFVNVRDVESNVDVPQLSVVVGPVFPGSTAAGSKLAGV